MLRFVVTLLVVLLGVAVVGTVITDLFWLTLVALAGILAVGAMGVSMHLRAPEAQDHSAPGESSARMRLMRGHGLPQRRDGLSRAA